MKTAFPDGVRKRRSSRGGFGASIPVVREWVPALASWGPWNVIDPNTETVPQQSKTWGYLGLDLTQFAGQRVQVIKKDKKQGGVLEFGTEMVTSADGSVAALLGASPGASTAVAIMLDLVQKCFAERAATPEWQARFRQLVPSFGQHLADDPALTTEVRERSHQALQLDA